jgi:hypothetical protein
VETHISTSGELRTSVSEFPQFGLIHRITAAEQEQNLLGRSYAQTENQIENYGLQEHPGILKTNSLWMDRSWNL